MENKIGRSAFVGDGETKTTGIENETENEAENFEEDNEADDEEEDSFDEDLEEKYGRGGFQKNFKPQRERTAKKYGEKTEHAYGSRAKEYWEQLDQKDAEEERNTTPAPSLFSQQQNYPRGNRGFRDTRPSQFSRKQLPPKEQHSPQPPQNEHGQSAPQTKFVAGPNSHIIRGYTIDFDRVDGLEKVSGEYNGHMTYGIKFLFSGKKGLYRTVWFNQNQGERDGAYEKESDFWKGLH